MHGLMDSTCALREVQGDWGTDLSVCVGLGAGEARLRRQHMVQTDGDESDQYRASGRLDSTEPARVRQHGS